MSGAADLDRFRATFREWLHDTVPADWRDRIADDLRGFWCGGTRMRHADVYVVNGQQTRKW